MLASLFICKQILLKIMPLKSTRIPKELRKKNASYFNSYAIMNVAINKIIGT